MFLFPEPQYSRFTQDRMGRSQSKVDEVLLPVLKRMHSPKVMEGLCKWVGLVKVISRSDSEMITS